MPLCTPQKGEKQDEFMSRCMGDDTMKKEFPEHDQRVAVCMKQWDEKEKGNSASYYQIKAQGEDAEVLLYGDIGQGWFEEGIGAKKFVDDLKSLGKIRNLNIRINSGGGSVFEGLAIFNAIDRHSATKTVHIDGLAASIASLIAMAGNKVVIADNAMMMIHNPFGMVLGNAKEMRAVADSLDKVKEGMILSYQRKSKLSEKEISTLMDDETWMTAKEAIRYGFVDQIGEGMRLAASVSSKFIPKYKKTPVMLVRNAEPPASPEEKVSYKIEMDKSVQVLTGLQSNPVASDPNPIAVVGNDSKAQFVSSEIHLVPPETLDRLKRKIYGGK